MHVARNNFSSVKVARSSWKVGQACILGVVQFCGMIPHFGPYIS